MFSETGSTPAELSSPSRGHDIDHAPLSNREQDCPGRKPVLLFVVNVDWFFVSHRLDLAIAAREAGFEVHVAAAMTDKREELESLGLTVHPLDLDRSNKSPVSGLLLCLKLIRIFRGTHPDVIHLVTIKPVLFGGIAARIGRVPAVVSAISGLGFVFTGPTRNPLDKLLRIFSLGLYNFALRHPRQTIIFQNPDDRDTIASTHGNRIRSRCRIIPGSGVNLDRCPVIPEAAGTPIVAMACRLLKDKGVMEFVEAARELHRRHVDARFWLIGDIDPDNPASLSSSDVRTIINSSPVEVLGFRSNVPDLYSRAHVVTLPSYREGFPKSLIEAAACARPVVTTDTPGCRHAIEEGVTGLLVPVADSYALANAMQRLIHSPELRSSMGQAGRRRAEANFDIRSIAKTHLNIYRNLMIPR